MGRRIESHMIAGPVGRLEALLEEPENQDPRMAALVCHPHPQHGGTMHNKVVHRLARGLRTAGAAVLRFNFRGVNLSEGRYAHGVGELDDARAALAWLRGRYPSLPCLLAGFSFGSRIVLKLGQEDPDLRAVIAAGFPTRYQDGQQYQHGLCPWVFVQSTNDEFGPRAQFQEFFDSVHGEKRLIWIEARDHFFSGALDALEATLVTLDRII
jgi:alpha/beta superfamily hydrolase